MAKIYASAKGHKHMLSILNDTSVCEYYDDHLAQIYVYSCKKNRTIVMDSIEKTFEYIQPLPVIVAPDRTSTRLRGGYY